MKNTYIFHSLYVITEIKDKIYTQFHKLILTFMLFTLCVNTTNAQIVFNEIMCTNMNGLYSEGVIPESWIELYNPTDSIIFDFNSIYTLGNTPKYEESFRIFNIWAMLPLCYVTVRCDKERGNVGFTLDSEGGCVYLFDNKGNIVDSLSYPKMQKADVSWGREGEGDQWGTMLRSTPGGPNTEIVEEFPHKVHFSVEGGVWEHLDPFYVEMTAKEVPDYYSEKRDVDTSLCIRYTLDGSEPTDTSKIYSEPVYVESSTCIRAKVFDATRPLLTSNSVSYINHGRPVDKNVVSLITDSLYFYGEEEGLMGNRASAALGFRRAMNFEYFPLNAEIKPLNLLCKARAGGNTSRMSDAYLNLVLYAKKKYGEKHFKTEFWPHLKPNVQENKSIYLRCGDKDYSCMRDALGMNMASYLNLDYQASDALSVYLNGKYYGFLYMYERSNEDYIWANYNKLDDVDLISFEGFQIANVKSGTSDEFNRLKDFWMSSPHSLADWKKMIDVEEYTNLIAMESFTANMDFWYNNTKLFKPRNDSSAVWRWIMNDLDVTFGNFYDRSYFQFIMDGKPDGAHNSEDYGVQFWRSLLSCDEYKSYFLDRIIAYHGDFLNKRLFNACADSIYKLAEIDIAMTKKLYYEEGTGYLYHNQLKDRIEKRSDYFHTDLQSFFDLGKAVKVKVNNEEDENATLFYNNVQLKTNSFDGWDFVDRNLSIQIKNGENIETINWIVEKSSGDKVETELYTNIDLLTYVIPSDVDSIVFTPTSRDFNDACENIISLTDIEILKSKGNFTIWDIYGRLIYCSDKKQKLILPKNVPLIISVDGCTKKIMF